MKSNINNNQINEVVYLGHSAVLLSSYNCKIAIDPWLQGNPVCPKEFHSLMPDLIVLTHGHSDHAGDVIRIMKNSNAKLIACFELAMLLIAEGAPSDRIIGMNKGGSFQLENFQITLSHAFHSNSFDSASGPKYAGEACSVIIKDQQNCFFHAGDTALFSDLKLIAQNYKPDLAFLPIGDVYTMGPIEAAQAAGILKVKHAVPIHYKTFPALTGSAEVFCSECEKYEVEASEFEIGKSYLIENLIS